jgi:hypothetical protein
MTGACTSFFSPAGGDGANEIAGRMLISLDPRCPDSCDAILRKIDSSQWDVSLKEIPFYLISQFGKWKLLGELEAFLAKRPPADATSRVDGILYWARMPTHSLASDLHYWEWQDVIEKDNP